MRSGKLRHRVTIQKIEMTQDATTGESVKTWSDLGCVWASVEPLSVREFLAADSNKNEVSARITIRYRADIDGSMRIVYRSKIYNIEGILSDAKSGLEYLTIPVSEGVNDG